MAIVSVNEQTNFENISKWVWYRGSHIKVWSLVLGWDTLEYQARVFWMRFLENTVIFDPIWLAQIMRNQNSNLMIQSDWAKSDHVFQQTHLKKSSVILLCVLTRNQRSCSNVWPPYILKRIVDGFISRLNSGVFGLTTQVIKIESDQFRL